MTANSGVKLLQAAATVDNTAIPYVENGTHTYARVELRDGYDGGTFATQFYAALSWSSGQGRLSSTGLRVHITDEEGDAVLHDYTWSLGSLGDWTTAELTHPRIDIEMMNPPSDTDERFEVWINGDGVYDLGDLWFGHGPDGFHRQRLYSLTENRSSQVPGGSSDTQRYNSSIYRSQFGTDDYKPSILLRSTYDGNVGFGQTYTYTYDANCAVP